MGAWAEPDIPNRCDNRCFDRAEYYRSVIYGDSLEISPDRNTLYYADSSLQGMYKYDVSGITPVLLLQTPFSTIGSTAKI